MQRSNRQIALLATGFGGVLFVLTYLMLGALAPGYDPLRDTISALEFVISSTTVLGPFCATSHNRDRRYPIEITWLLRFYCNLDSHPRSLA